MSIVSEGSSSGSGSQLEIIPLGAGSEVGRSCIVMKYLGKTVMFDCGVHPALEGRNSLPFFERINPEEVDVVLVTHCHSDHCAALPYFCAKTTFRNGKGKVVMTPPTRDLMITLLDETTRTPSTTAPASEAATSSAADAAPEDAAASGGSASGEPDASSSEKRDSDLEAPPLYDKSDVEEMFKSDKLEMITFGTTIQINDINITCYNAGHILGAAMFLVEIAGRTVLYTGDYSREEDHHLRSATLPDKPVDVLICESTFGTALHNSRRQREENFTRLVSSIVMRGGHCLIPMFSVGRTQELLLLLDEFWDRNPSLQNIKLYWVSNKAQQYLDIFKKYSRDFLNDNIQMRMRMMSRDPFDFKYVKCITQRMYKEDGQPCVVIASPGMLQNGVSRYFYNIWHDDPANGIVFAGYSVKGSFAFSLLDRNQQRQKPVEIKASVDEESFSAHADYNQTREFIEALHPRFTVLVHGEKRKMNALYLELRKRYNTKMTVYTPADGEVVQLPMQKKDGVVRIIGSLADQCRRSLLGSETGDSPEMDDEEMDVKDEDGGQPMPKRACLAAPVDGFLVRQDTTYTLTSASELSQFTGLKTVQIKQSADLPFHSSLRSLAVTLNEIFGYHDMVSSVAINLNAEETAINIVGRLNLCRKDDKTLRMEWISGTANDDLADVVAASAISLEVDKEAQERAKQLEEKSHQPTRNIERMRKVCLSILRRHFGTAEPKPDDPNTLVVDSETMHATVTLPKFIVTCSNPEMEETLRSIVGMIRTTLLPLRPPGSRSETELPTVKREQVTSESPTTKTEMN